MSSLSNAEVYAKVLNDLVEVQKEYTVLPLVKVYPPEYKGMCYELPALHILNHTHLINYGGTVCYNCTRVCIVMCVCIVVLYCIHRRLLFVFVC